jgi:integrase
MLCLRYRRQAEQQPSPRRFTFAKDALGEWLTLRGDEPGPLFYRVRKGGALVAGRVSTTSLQRMLAKRAEEAGIAPFTWHDMRRTAAGDLLDAGADIVTVQRLLGHADPRTTSRYDRRPEQAKRQAVAKLNVPYRRRRA